MGGLNHRRLIFLDESAVNTAMTGDNAAARRLFAAAEAAVEERTDQDLSLTIYTSDGRPLAWGGRPSEIPSDRLQAGEAWFFAQGALGLRLVYVAPIMARTTRIGTMASERACYPFLRVDQPGILQSLQAQALDSADRELRFAALRAWKDGFRG